MPNPLGIGLGIYTEGLVSDAVKALPPRGGCVLVMGVDGDERHDVAAEFRAQGRDVTRRRHIDDGHQIDYTASFAVNAGNWYRWILGGLAPEHFRAIYHRAVGFNECYDNGRKDLFPFMAGVELRLCEMLQAVGIDYAWGSIACGNVDPEDFTTTFAAINKIAAAVCYHGYAKPGATTLEGATEPWWMLRPYTWFNATKNARTRFPPLFLGESGPYTAPSTLGMDAEVTAALLGQISGTLAVWRANAMPVIGHCGFGLGTIGVQKPWAYDGPTIQAIRAFNQGALDMSPPVAPSPASDDALIFPGAVLDLVKSFGYPKGTRGRNGYKVMAIVRHIEGGTETATDATFENEANQVSANVSISRAGVARVFVPGRDPAWGNGILNKPNMARRVVKWCVDNQVNPNLVTFSIEHEGVPGQPWTEAQYQASLAVHRWAFKVFNLPLDPEVLLDHADIDSVNRAHCAGPAMPRERFLVDLGIKKPTPPAPVPPKNPATFTENVLHRPTVLAVCDDLWALAEGRRADHDPVLADNLEAGIIRIKQLLKL